MNRMVRNLLRSRLVFTLGCVATAALWFWATLMLLDRWRMPSPGEVAAALPPGTLTSKLSDLPSFPDSKAFG